MAIIPCPNCDQRMSSLAKSCPKCKKAVGELTEEDQHRLLRKRWRHQLDRAANLTYVALALLVGGVIWWWGAPPQGWFFPPPVGAVILLPLGLVTYGAGRGWIFWLRLRRNRPPID